MKIIPKYAKLMLVTVLCCSLWIASIATAGQKTIGSYVTNSRATATHSNGVTVSMGEAPNLPAPGIAGLAVVGVLVGAFVVGFIDGWNATTIVKDPATVPSNYNSDDFTRFDN